MKKLSTLLIILGIIVFCTPFLGKLYINHTQQKMLKTYMTELGENEILEEIPTPETVDTEEDSKEKATEETTEKASISGVIGRIALPSISSDQLLLEGSDVKQLKYGAGYIKGTALPGEKGNCCIAGHRNYTFGTYFNRIDELKNGDTIEIFYDNTVYKYEVYESFVVSPEEVSVLSGTKEESIVTLITCHPKGSNTQRLIVRGQLINY